MEDVSTDEESDVLVEPRKQVVDGKERRPEIKGPRERM